MLITRSNPLGGRPLSSYPLDEDKITGQLGYKLGYCHCGESILIRTIDLSYVIDRFGLSQDYYKKNILSRLFSK